MTENNPYTAKVELNEAFRWKRGTPRLGTLDMELTERCNNDCIHCCINLPAMDTESAKRELSFPEIKEILREAASLGCLTVRLTGGEPLLREDFEEIYRFTRRLGMKVLLFTNATLITGRIADLLSRLPPLEKIEVSLYGMHRVSYEAVTRTPGSFEAARRGIDCLLSKRIPFVVKSALLPPNREEPDEFEAWAAALPWTDKPPSYAMRFDLRCRRDSATRNRMIANLRPPPQEAVSILKRRGPQYAAEMREFCSKFTRPAGPNLFSCGAGAGRGCVDAYGNLQLCLMLRHPDTVYDLKTGSLTDGVTRFFPGIRALQAMNPDYLERCAACFLKGLCEQCPAKSWMEHGTLDTPVDYFCDIAHAQARDLGLLDVDEIAWAVADWEKRIAGFCMKEKV